MDNNDIDMNYFLPLVDTEKEMLGRKWLRVAVKFNQAAKCLWAGDVLSEWQSNSQPRLVPAGASLTAATHAAWWGYFE